MKLKKVVSKLLKVDVETFGWDEAFRKSQTQGDMGVALSEIVKELCKHVDPYIPDVIEKPESINEQVNVYNPTTKDFSVSFDLMGNGSAIVFTAKSQEIGSFDPHVAIHLKKHLINKILQDRGINYPTEIDIKKVDKEVSVVPTI